MKLGVCPAVGPAGRYGLGSPRRHYKLRPPVRWAARAVRMACLRRETHAFGRVPPPAPAARPKAAPRAPAAAPYPAPRRRFPLPAGCR